MNITLKTGGSNWNVKTIGLVICLCLIVVAVGWYLFGGPSRGAEVRDLGVAAERVVDNSRAVGTAQQGAIDSSRELGNELKRIADETNQLAEDNNRATELSREITQIQRINLETIKHSTELPGRIKQIIQDVRAKGPVNNKGSGQGNPGT